MSLIVAMLMLLLTWLLAGLVVLGLGAGLWRLLGLERAAAASGEPAGEPVSSENDTVGLHSGGGLPRDFRGGHPPAALWVGPADGVWRGLLIFGLGLVGLVGLLQAWHLALPVDAWSLVAVGVASLGGWAWGFPELRSAWGRLCSKGGVGVLVGWGLVGLWLSNRASGGASEAVSGLAWYPLVGWLDGYPAVPGVANVHPVYGWNAGGLLVSAWLSEGPWVGRVGHASNGWLLWWLALPALVAWRKLLERKGGGEPAMFVASGGASEKSTVGTVFDACWLAPMFLLAMGSAVTDPLPGVGAGVLLWVAGGAAVRMSGADETHRGRRIDALVVALLCCCGSGAWDPMALPAAGVLAGFVAWRLMKSERAWVEGRRPTRSIGFDHEKLPGLSARSGSVTAAGVLGVCVLGLWAARNVVMSGYAAFPLSAKAGLPLEWTVPSREAALGGWLPRVEPLDFAVGGSGLVLLPLLGGGGLLMLWLVKGGGEGRWKHCGGAVAALLLAAAAWFAAGRGGSAFGPAWAGLAAGLALNARAVVQRGRPMKGPSGSALAGMVAGAALGLSVLHVLVGGGGALWPMGKDAEAALAMDAVPQTYSVGLVMGEPGAAASKDGGVVLMELMPVRLPGMAGAGLADRRTPDLQPWFSQWGVEVALTASPMPGGALAVDADADADALSATTGPLPWAAPQPSLTRAPSTFLRYRGGPENVRAGFVIDRRAPGSFMDPADGVRSADRDRRWPDGS